MEDLGLIPGLGRSPGEGKGYPLQYSSLENFMGCTMGVAKSQTRLSDFPFPSFPGDSDHKECLQCRRPGFDSWVGKISWRKGMAIHPSILAWRIPWAEEPGGLQSMGSLSRNVYD